MKKKMNEWLSKIPKWCREFRDSARVCSHSLIIVSEGWIPGEFEVRGVPDFSSYKEAEEDTEFSKEIERETKRKSEEEINDSFDSSSLGGVFALFLKREKEAWIDRSSYDFRALYRVFREPDPQIKFKICKACGYVIRNEDRVVWHHLSYLPEETIPVHRRCHYDIHLKGKYPELNPWHGRS